MDKCTGIYNYLKRHCIEKSNAVHSSKFEKMFDMKVGNVRYKEANRLCQANIR